MRLATSSSMSICLFVCITVSPHSVRATMTGKVVSFLVEVGSSVKKGDAVVILESMKMETSLVSPQDGIVGEILAQPNQIVDARQVLIVLKE